MKNKLYLNEYNLFFVLRQNTLYDRISFVEIQMFAKEKQKRNCQIHNIIVNMGKKVKEMKETTKYYVVKEKAVPEVLLKVVEAKKLMETRKAVTIQEAVDMVGISRSSFYKYKDDIFQFHDNSQGTTLTMTFNIDDEPGVLSDVLKGIADFGANILTIHQSIPINGIAALSISVQVLQTTGDISHMLEVLEAQEGVHQVKILAKE